MMPPSCNASMIASNSFLFRFDPASGLSAAITGLLLTIFRLMANGN